MKFLVIALIGCLFAAQAEAGKLMHEEGHLNEFRPRTGHLRQAPFTDLFVYYARVFIKPLFPQLPADHHSFYTPTGSSCITFFKQLKVKAFKLQDLDKFALLDACLGYLYESRYQEQDMEESPFVAKELEEFKNNPTLKSLYDNTEINKLDDEAKDCIGDLLLGAIRLRDQYKDVTCNNHWIEEYLKFARCQHTIPKQDRRDDSYVNTIFELVKKRGKECFDTEIQHTNQAVRKYFKDDTYQRMKDKLSRDSKARQSLARYWPKTIREVLIAMSRPANEINLRDVNLILTELENGGHAATQRFLKNLALYSDEKLKPNSKGFPAEDTDGSFSYSNLVNKLCLPWRRTDSEDDYNFFTSVERLLDMLKFEDIFGISLGQFQTTITNFAHETAPVYFSISTCNWLSYTDGYLTQPSHNSKKSYAVSLVEDRTGMVLWPTAGFV